MENSLINYIITHLVLLLCSLSINTTTTTTYNFSSFFLKEKQICSTYLLRVKK
jgi:uncharacterized Tic20 family protein